MFTGPAKELTDLARRFTAPSNATHRQYEALRAYFVEGLSGVEAARRFGYTPGSFRVLVHHFRRDPHRAFFITPAKGPPHPPVLIPLPQRAEVFARPPRRADDERPPGSRPTTAAVADVRQLDL